MTSCTFENCKAVYVDDAIMTGEEFKKIREYLNLSQSEMADQMLIKGSYRRRTISRWENDICIIPGPVSVLMKVFKNG